ncbi:MAG TPA: L-aspartate oxidase [Candidatus Limnocylindrales bacterium]|nr:L-aspartate oxidase [Candidatus Limnocylindrales bacterium]
MPHFDYLVIGSGIAGMTFAVRAAVQGRVAILTKRALEDSNTNWAQGGVAAVWAADDSVEQHVRDTIEAGAGLCNRDVVELVVSEGPARIRELIALGVQFSLKNGEGSAGGAGDYELGLEGGHSRRRILHAADHTGKEMVRALSAEVRRNPNIDVFESRFAIDLLIDEKFGYSHGQPQCWGAYVLDTTTGAVDAFTAGATLLATGGTGKVYLYTSNPDIASGDGIAMAWRAGCRVADMEFIQFHPTCLYHPQAKSFLVTEAMRGEGAVLRRPDGQPFMANYDPRGELAPRDIVARAIDHEMKMAGFDNVLLDVTARGEDFIKRRFPAIYERCLTYGIDITRQPIPVVPAQHYMCGGVMTGLDGETSVDRLYAAGEVAMTGLHGANRLASNSLLEGLVFGHRAAEHARRRLAQDPQPPPRIPAWSSGRATDINESVVIAHNWDEIRRLMWNYVGIVRSDRRLARAAARITMIREEIQQYYWDFLVTRDLLELRNIALVADLMVRSARTRRESRGLHYNVDCPERDDAHWLRHTVI